MQKLYLKQKIELTIQALGENGEGIGYWLSHLFYVEGALPQETIECEVSEIRSTYNRAKLLRILIPSPFRVIPICPLFATCGGCQLMHLDYSKQLELKQQKVVQAFAEANVENVDVMACMPSPSAFHYRNKIQLPILQETQGLIIGLYARNSHQIIEMEKCAVHSELGEQVFKQVKAILQDSFQFLLEGSQQLLRYLIIKTAMNTQQALVVFVTSESTPQEDKVLLQASQKILAEYPPVKGVVQNINCHLGNTILGNSFKTVAGDSFIVEHLCGLAFKVSPASFFQVNPAQAECLYQKAIALAQLSEEDVVLDAYCGVGTLSLLLSRCVKKVIGIECVPEAIEDAKENAKRNSISNVDFICANSEVFISSMDDCDVVLLNPPRKGCEPSFLTGLARLKPRCLVYISCNPKTLARDVSILNKMGYHLDGIQPYDMFPQTTHVETIVKMVRG